MKIKQLLVALALAASTTAHGCLSVPATSPAVIGEGRRVLFIGNSLTYVNELPSIVQSLADSAHGDKLAVAMIALPDYALIDHWTEGAAAKEIAKGGWEFVVLQQGPSSVGVNRDTLRLATKLFAPGIVAGGGRPALFSVWPTIDRKQDFARAIESYTLAASDVNGILLPVAAAWLAAWKRDSTAQLYSPDGLHPSVIGSYLAALVIYSQLLEKTPIGLPATLRVGSQYTLILPPAQARMLQEAAAEATGR